MSDSLEAKFCICKSLKSAELLFHATRVEDRTSLDLILLLKVTTPVRHTAPSCSVASAL